MQYDEFNAMVGRELVHLEAALINFRSLRPAYTEIDIVEKIQQRVEPPSRHRFAILIAAESVDDVIRSICTQIRGAVFSILRLSFVVCTKQTRKNCKYYRNALIRYKNLPVVTYNAKSDIEIEFTIANTSQPLARLAEHQPFFSLTENEWSNSVKKCEESLQSLKNFSIQISKDRAEWQKFSDDSKRLWAALIALTIGGASLLSTQAPILYNWIFSKPTPQRFSMTCRMDMKTEDLRCEGIEK